MGERVLVIPRDQVPGGCDYRGMRALGVEAASELARAIREHGEYVERAIAEEDPTRKQVIPYVVVRDGGLVFLMERTDAGRDPRLHRKASIGVGGHLNPVDGGADPLDAGLRREWKEELKAAWQPDFRMKALLNDDSNPVGSVHIGVVFTVEAAGRPVDVREHEKLSGRLVEPDVLRAAWDRLETWSQLVAGELLGIPGPPD